MSPLEHQTVLKALDFAKIALAGKKRESGEDIIDHCVEVAKNLVRFEVTDPATLAVAILHHTFSDGAATGEDVKKEFGEDTLGMIEAFDRLSIIKLKAGMKEQLSEQLRKMFLVLAKDLRVVLIKMADILNNLKTLKYLELEKGKEVAEETLEIFAPLVERLGMGELKGQMQDLAFEFLDPENYQKVKDLEKTNLKEAKKTLSQIENQLQLVLTKENIKYRIESRAKHLFSLFCKLKRPEINFDISKVYDLIAFRVIVKNTEDCYRVLGVIHKLWKPIPNYVRDYIANPRPNGYSSIHTTVFGPKGNPFEIQIRSEEMHEEAEFGLASHWNYSEKKASGLSDEEISKGFATSAEKLDWVKRLSQWHKEISNSQEFLKTVKTDFFGQRIFCFTPKGDIKDLPPNATPIDFAYSVHTLLGDQAMGAKVNGKVASLDTKLKNGDVVEILLSKNLQKKPSRDWLKFVVTGLAKRKIKKAYA
ncbi:MAG: RelA/SpoT family protein [Candidatus Daviesbacteria bacterium]